MSTYLAYDAYKRQVIAALQGRVLEIGAGAGNGLALLSSGVAWQGLEPDPRQYARLSRVAQTHQDAIGPLLAPAEDLPLPDASVDGVLSIVTLCSVADPELVVSEARRVLRPGGLLVFAEHVAAPAGTWSRRVQGVVAPLSRRFDRGCNPLRDTEATVHGSGLGVRELRRFELRQPLGVRIPYVVGVAVR